MEPVADFISLGFKITVHSDCNHKMERYLHLGGKALTNLDGRDITLLTKFHVVKPMVLPVVTYGYESWSMKGEHQIDAFKLWCCRRLLRVRWTGSRLNQSILKEMSPEYSLEGLMLKLKLQYLGHLMWTADSLEKTDAGKDWRQKGKEGGRGWYG